MDAFNEDFKVFSKGNLKSYEIEFESLTQEAVEKLMQADIEHISGILGVDVRSFLSFIVSCLVVNSFNYFLFLFFSVFFGSIGERSCDFVASYALE